MSVGVHLSRSQTALKITHTSLTTCVNVGESLREAGYLNSLGVFVLCLVFLCLCVCFVSFCVFYFVCVVFVLL